MAKKKSVKKKTSGDDRNAPRFKGVTFLFSGTLEHCKKKQAEDLIKAEGGKIAKSVTADLNYLILGKSRGKKTAAEKKADTLNNKGAAIAVLNETAFQQLFIPEQQELIGMLSNDHERWQKTVGLPWLQVDLVVAGMKLNDGVFSNINLANVTFENCQFKDTDFYKLQIKSAANCKFERCEFNDIRFHEAIGCSFRKSKIEHCRFDTARVCDFREATGSSVEWEFIDCDFRKANIEYFHFTDLQNCNMAGGTFNEMYSFRANCEHTVFDKCVFSASDDVTLNQLAGSNMSFVGADLKEVDFSNSSFQHSDFTRAKLNNANFSDVDLTGANLSKADLRGANFTGAKLDDANVAGANFTDAIISGTTLKNVDSSKAKGLNAPPAAAAGAIGPNARALEKAMKKSNELTTEINVRVNDRPHSIRVFGRGKQSGYGSGYAAAMTTDDKENNTRASANTFAAAMLEAATRLSGGEPELPSITVKRSKCPLKPKEAKELAMKAWCEVFGLPIPTEEELQAQQAALADREGAFVQTLLAELRGGKKGIAKWNARSDVERRREAKFRGVDLSGADLRGAEFFYTDFREADLSNAKIGGEAVFNLYHCDFTKANLSGAEFFHSVSSCKFTKANLQNAKMSGIKIVGDLRGVDLTGVDLSQSQIEYSNIRGADFTNANLKGVAFEEVDYDETTIFPKGFRTKKGLKYAGQGKDPRVLKKIKKAAKSGPISFEEFMQQLANNFDASRLNKAKKMLKADSFQLFSEVTDSSFVGVVKSQTDASLVYSCRLDADGQYTCCTQNLNACGGLRGALCKHLLVLIIGLTKANELDPTMVNQWVAASKLQKPQLEKDAMSEVFLKYKGAEAGEIDWRPTETVPEDYYAF